MNTPNYAAMTLSELVTALCVLLLTCPIAVAGRFWLLNRDGLWAAVSAQVAPQPGDTAPMTLMREFLRRANPGLNIPAFMGNGGVPQALKGKLSTGVGLFQYARLAANR